MAKDKTWLVTTSGDRPLSEVKKEVEKHGFQIGEVLNEIGVITGSGGDAVAEKLRDVPGVADVSPDTPIDIGPPDAPVTW